jgi:hydrogenase maturation protease
MEQSPVHPKILIAGVGNELRQDDAFGLLVARELINQKTLPANVNVLEFGIGGIHLVQELHEQYDVLVILDAVKWGGKPGDIFWRSADTADISELPTSEKRNFLADMHYTNPVRALMLARAINVLPPQVYILGCEVASKNDFDIGISKEVEQAIPKAIEKLTQWLDLYNENDPRR